MPSVGSHACLTAPALTPALNTDVLPALSLSASVWGCAGGRVVPVTASSLATVASEAEPHLLPWTLKQARVLGVLRFPRHMA